MGKVIDVEIDSVQQELQADMDSKGNIVVRFIVKEVRRPEKEEVNHHGA